jgi:hypothetical protein
MLVYRETNCQNNALLIEFWIISILSLQYINKFEILVFLVLGLNLYELKILTCVPLFIFEPYQLSSKN